MPAPPEKRCLISQFDAEWLGKVAEATEVDVLARPLATSAATAAKGAARIVVPAYGLSTVRLTLNR